MAQLQSFGARDNLRLNSKVQVPRGGLSEQARTPSGQRSGTAPGGELQRLVQEDNRGAEHQHGAPVPRAEGNHAEEQRRARHVQDERMQGLRGQPAEQ